MKLEPPECILGYTQEQVIRILTINNRKLEDFEKWAYGNTCGICEGKAYNYETEEYYPSGCGPHGGPITYECDLIDFLEGRRNLD